MYRKSAMLFASAVGQIVQRKESALPVTQFLRMLDGTMQDGTKLQKALLNNVKDSLSKLQVQLLSEARSTVDTAVLDIEKGDLRSAQIALKSTIKDLTEKFEVNDPSLLKDAYFHYGVALERGSVRYREEALKSFEEVLKLDPAHVEATKHVASIQSSMLEAPKGKKMKWIAESDSPVLE